MSSQGLLDAFEHECPMGVEVIDVASVVVVHRTLFLPSLGDPGFPDLLKDRSYFPNLKSQAGRRTDDPEGEYAHQAVEQCGNAQENQESSVVWLIHGVLLSDRALGCVDREVNDLVDRQRNSQTEIRIFLSKKVK